VPVEATRRRRSRTATSSEPEASAAGQRTAAGAAAITLGLLDALHDTPSISQRSLASELGIALGLTNAYIRRCVRRGLVKVSQAPANRYAYYLTPKGFAEKSRLTARFLTSSFGLYRRARQQCDDLLAEAVARRWQRIALFGVGDIAEIAVLCAIGQPLTIVGAINPRSSNGATFMNLPVAPSVRALDGVDGVLFASLQRPQEGYDALVREIEPERVLVPALLKVRAANGADGTPPAVQG